MSLTSGRIVPPRRVGFYPDTPTPLFMYSCNELQIDGSGLLIQSWNYAARRVGYRASDNKPVYMMADCPEDENGFLIQDHIYQARRAGYHPEDGKPVFEVACCDDVTVTESGSGRIRCSCCHPFPPKRTYIMTLTSVGPGSCSDTITIPITLVEAIDEPPGIPCAIFWRTWVGGPIGVSSGVHGSCNAYGQMRCKVFQDGCLGFYLNAVIRTPMEEETLPWVMPWDDALHEINGLPGVCDCEDFEITPDGVIEVPQSSCCYIPPGTVGESYTVQVLE